MPEASWMNISDCGRGFLCRAGSNTVRIARTDAMVKMLNIAIVLVEIVMYGFVILLVLMGFTSVISTLTTNIRIRSREFAVLKSVGMTN